MSTPLSRGLIEAKFKRMRIPHRGIAALTAACNGAREGAKFSPHEPKSYIELFAPSHTGKSTAIKTYIETTIASELIAEGVFPADMPRHEIARQQRRVLHVTLTEKANRKSMYSDILRRCGDTEASKGTIENLRDRTYDYLSDNRVELLILDEIQHLSFGVVKQVENRKVRQLESQGTEVTDALKNMMIHGLVPMVLAGVPEARIHLAVDEQLTNRYLEQVDFSPLKWSDDDDRDMFTEFCGEMGIEIHVWEMLPEVTNLLVHGIPHMLWAASGGRLGVAARILEEAVFHTTARSGSVIELEDLALAVDTRAIPKKWCLYNPFREGVLDDGDFD